jgi:hypothetical protein
MDRRGGHGKAFVKSSFQVTANTDEGQLMTACRLEGAACTLVDGNNNIRVRMTAQVEEHVNTCGYLNSWKQGHRQ